MTFFPEAHRFFSKCSLGGVLLEDDAQTLFQWNVRRYSIKKCQNCEYIAFHQRL